MNAPGHTTEAAGTVDDAVAQDERERLRRDGERIERLLDELRASSGPTVWPRIEELVARMTALHGAGLERMLGHLVDADALTGPVVERLCGDEVVSGLLLLHGLHPLSTATRVERALDSVRPYLASHAGGVELRGIDDAGVVTIRMVGTCQGCSSQQATVDDAIRRAVEDAAPEVVRIVVEGEGAPRVVGAAP